MVNVECDGVDGITSAHIDSFRAVLCQTPERNKTDSKTEIVIGNGGQPLKDQYTVRGL